MTGLSAESSQGLFLSETMLTRVIISFVLQYYRTIISIDPNTGNELGKQEGDKINTSMGRPASITQRMFIIMDRTQLFFGAILSVIFKLHQPLGIIDWVAFSCATLGLILSYWAYHVLGEFYTFTLGIRNNHRIIQDGPYQYFVHPGYLGQFLVFFSCIIFFRVDLVFTLIAPSILLMYMSSKRMNTEEEMMRQRFGDAYSDFVSQRWRIMPNLF